MTGRYFLKTTLTQIGKWKKRVEIEISAEEVRPFIEKKYRRYQKEVSVKGFRKGKVPLPIIRQNFGEAIRAEISDDLVQNYFSKALESEKIVPITPGVVKEIFFEENKPFRFTAEVEVEPEVEVFYYKGIKVEKEVEKVTREDVEKVISVLREQKATLKPVKEGAKRGHIVQGHIQALDRTGIPIIGEKWEDRIIEIGVPPLGDVLQDQLLGAVAGESRKVVIVQPERGPDGKPREVENHYMIDIKSVNEKLLPSLENGFAQELGNFKTISELEAGIQKNLEMQRDNEAERALHRRIVDEIIRRNDFEIPPAMIDNTLTSLWEEYQKQPEYEFDEAQFRQENRASVIWNIKWHLIWHAIADVEGIEVSESTLDEEIEKFIQAAPKEDKKLRVQFKDSKQRKRFHERVLEDRVMQFLIQEAKIKIVNLKKTKKRKPLIHVT